MQVASELAALGVASSAIDGILEALSMRTVGELAALLGPEDEAVADLRQLFALAEAYGYADWLVFDASVVRGLAYYTGGGWAGGTNGWMASKRRCLSAQCSWRGRSCLMPLPASMIKWAGPYFASVSSRRHRV